MSVSSPTRKCEASRANESSARGLALIISARPPETSPRLVSNLSTGGETCVLERHWWEPACIKFCNHMFKNSRKRYRDRGKDTRIQPALKQIRLWHLIPYTLRKKKKNSSPQVFICTYWVSSEISSRSNIRSSLSSNLVLKILLWILVILWTLIPEIPKPWNLTRTQVSFFFNNLSVESNHKFLRFCYTLPCDWSRKLAPFSPPIRSKRVLLIRR